jgi:hypothetical protein
VAGQNQRDIEAIIKRHRKFWSLEQVDRPLLVVPVDIYAPTKRFCSTLIADALNPSDVDSAKVMEEYDRMAMMHEEIGDDYLVAAEPVLGVPWLEAMVGCPIHVSSTGAMAAKSVQDPQRIQSIAVSQENPWLQASLNYLKTASRHAAGRYPVCVGHLRGSTDILFALMGSESFFLSFYDQPERILTLAQMAANAWVEAATAQLKVVPRFHDGYVLRWFGIWAPKPTVWYQDDASTMISRDFYQNLFLSSAKRALVFPYSVFHLHSPSLHIVDSILEANPPNLRAFNINMDPTGISIDKAIPVLQRIQNHHKSLILSKDLYENFTLEEYDEIIQSLSPRGLCVWLDGRTAQEAQEILALAKEHTAKNRTRMLRSGK